MGLKDKINKISAVGSISSAAVIASGIVLENKELFGFENAMLLYVLLPSALIWFGTRKNGWFLIKVENSKSIEVE